jgi:DnaJ-domain-containing protein 1
MLGISSQMDKIKIDVQVELHNGKQLLGVLFLRRDQRMSDLLNDQRSFLPLEKTDGLVINLSKSHIAQVTQLGQVVNARGRQDPYQILGVDTKASDDEVRNTYHRRVQNYHPDVIQGAGLPREFVDLANMQMARINDAFERIQVLRNEQGTSKPSQAGRGAP